ncbi:MAG: NUDIX hydrolase [Nanoarchaeota archaeon]
MEKRPKVGIGVLVRLDNKVLLGKRINAHNAGTWAFPGGHLEWYESFEDCARREVLEETGMTVKNVRFAGVTNDFFIEDEKHYVTIFMICDHDHGVAEIREPDKCTEWNWFSWDRLPSPLMVGVGNLLHSGYHPFRD